jgi:hypothetical protein
MPSLFSRPALVAGLLLLPALASAAPPAAPEVNVGAGLKQLRFDFEPVAGASSYQLWFRANGGAGWVKYMDSTAATTEFKVTVSAHLLDWFNARYYVTACNTDGCSRTPDIYVTSLMRDTVGYFKQRSTAIEPREYGQNPALSADGTTLAVFGGETRGPRQRSASVMVYRKGISGWVQEARLEPTPVEEATGYGAFSRNLAINANGTVVVVGVPQYYTPGANAFPDGAAYIFRRGSSGWVLEKMIGHPRESREFAKVVDIDDAGETVALWRSNAGVPGELGQQGAIEIYKYAGGTWSPQTTVRLRPGSGECNGFAMSGNGRILARACVFDGEILELDGTQYVRRQVFDRGYQVSASNPSDIDTDFDGSVIVAATARSAPEGASWHPYYTVYRRDAAGWQTDPDFTYVGGRATRPPSNYYGGPVAVSADGRFIAVGAYNDENAGSGVVRGPLTRTSVYSGAVFVFERKPTAWSLRNMIKPNVPANNLWFGAGLSFGDNGKILAVGSPLEDSGARGIDGDQTDTSAPDSGAAWLY